MTDEQLDQTVELMKKNKFLLIAMDESGKVTPVFSGLNVMEAITLLESMEKVGYKCSVARSFEEAKQIIEE